MKHQTSKLDLTFKKGEFQGECNRTVCNNTKVSFYNIGNGMFYCGTCARLIDYTDFPNGRLCYNLNSNEVEALGRFNRGETYSVSTFIDDDTIIAGYGKLDYDFEYPLPTFLIKKEYGTLSWTEYLKYKQDEKENKSKGY